MNKMRFRAHFITFSFNKMAAYILENELITDRYTLVKVTFGDRVTTQEFDKFLSIFSQLLDIADKTGKPFAILFDVRNTNLAPFQTVKQIVGWKKKETERIKTQKKLVCTAVCVTNKIVKDLISSALFISRPHTPNIITTDIDKAKIFCTEQLNQIK